MSDYKIVDQSQVRRTKRVVVGKYAKTLAQIIDLPVGKALEVGVSGRWEGANFVRQLQKIAKQEHGVGELGWNRSEDFKTYWFWLDRR